MKQDSFKGGRVRATSIIRLGQDNSAPRYEHAQHLCNHLRPLFATEKGHHQAAVDQVKGGVGQGPGFGDIHYLEGEIG